MARIITIVLSFLFLLTTISNAQRLERFSEDHAEFIRQLEEYMTSSKREVLEEAYKEFADVFASGQFTEEEVQQILKTGNAMLELRMTAGPYFQNYLRALTKVKNTKDPARVFQEWHSVMDQMLAGIENRRLRPFDDFLEFSSQFFERRALRYSDSGGTSWYAYTDDFTFKYEEEQPVVTFEGLDLMAQRRTDSIFIYQTSGTFEPVERMWRGTGGRVTWERHGLPKGVFAELGDYEFEAIKSLYTVEDAKMHYPVYFGNKAVTGTFSDKLVSSSDAVEGSFPRFESTERLEVSNIGEGIAFEGYFRLHGTTVYGFGNKQQPARINIRDANSTASFRGASELFTIRREDHIAGSGVEGVLYFGKDSIYHPSVDVRFEIKEREMTLTRGESAADQNPFYSSLHGINFYANSMTAYLNGDSIAIGRGKLPYQRKEDVFF